jgi:hypothetical protein
MQVRRLGGAVVEFVPAPGQLPFCLVYSMSERGVVRQLTMTHENKSVPCEPNAPLLGLSFRIPLEEGSVRLYSVFSDQKLNAASIGEQIFELSGRRSVSAMDLRAPGKIALEVTDFVPTDEPNPTLGGLIGEGGEVDPDGGMTLDGGMTVDGGMTLDGGTPAPLPPPRAATADGGRPTVDAGSASSAQAPPRAEPAGPAKASDAGSAGSHGNAPPRVEAAEGPRGTMDAGAPPHVPAPPPTHPVGIPRPVPTTGPARSGAIDAGSGDGGAR